MPKAKPMALKHVKHVAKCST